MLAGAFYFTIPGPKMIWQFGELGYDISINQNGRTGNKPILWNYFDVPERKNIYNTWSKIIELKLNYDIFKTANYTLNVGNANGLNTIHLTKTDATDIKYITIIGNFGITSQNINPNFQQTGDWYNLLENNNVINISNVNANINLAPGEFKIFGSSPATLSINDNILQFTKVFVYPNPVEDFFKLNKEADLVQIFDITGKKSKRI